MFVFGNLLVVNYDHEHWYFFSKIVLTHYEKKSSSDREKLLKFNVEGSEFKKKIHFDNSNWKKMGFRNIQENLVNNIFKNRKTLG